MSEAWRMLNIAALGSASKLSTFKLEMEDMESLSPGLFFEKFDNI